MFTHRVITAIVGIPLVLIGLYCGGAPCGSSSYFSGLSGFT